MTVDKLELKKAAALHAVDYVQDGMLLGLGSGSTAELAIRQLGARIQNGLRITAVPTSNRTAQLARQLNIPLTTLQLHPRLHLTIDGADQVLLPSLTVIKGLGGALLREKIVALASHTVILIVDQTKVVNILGEGGLPLPVEIVTFGWNKTCAALANLGCQAERRTLSSPTDHRPPPYITDSGNYLIDCHFPTIQDPPALAARIKAITGVVEHGIFANIASRLIVATTNGIQIVDRQDRRE